MPRKVKKFFNPKNSLTGPGIEHAVSGLVTPCTEPKDHPMIDEKVIRLRPLTKISRFSDDEIPYDCHPDMRWHSYQNGMKGKQVLKDLDSKIG